MRRTLTITLMAMAGGCAVTPIDPVRKMYDQGWSSIHRAEGDANDRAAADAEADILRAFTKLKGNLDENSSVASRRGKDMAETFRGLQIPELSPDELGDVIGRLIDAAARADSRRLVDFRRSIAGRDNPDGFDPVRRAVLDRELSRRDIIAHRTRH